MTTAIYARYSSDLQSVRSIDDQIVACEEFAQRHGLPGPYITFTDAALSGASMATRPGLLSLMTNVRARKVTAIVSEAIDRLSRDQADLHLIRRAATANGVGLFTIADGEVDGMKAGLQGIMAEAFLVNLAQKTRRGMKGVARSGRIAGGLCFGYKPVVGKPGERTIDETEAAIVRRIFDAYAGGTSPFAIARALNAEGVMGPRGKLWKVNAILGDARVGDGILCNELYRGRIVFNRRRYVKNPETGKRSSFINPEADWIVAEAPHLRIVSDEQFDGCKAVRGELSDAPRQNDRHRPKRLLSGLLMCAACGGPFVIRNRGRFACANVINGTGLCEVRESLPADLVERRVIEGLRRNLLAPHVIAEAVKSFQEERRTMAVEENRQRRDLERTIEETTRRASRVADQLIDNPSPMLKTKLAEAEAALVAAQRALEALPDESIVALHPSAAEGYRTRVAVLETVLAGEATDDLKGAVRGLLDRIELAPDAGAADGWAITICGKLAELLAFGAGEPCRVSYGAGAHTERSPTTMLRLAG